MAQLNDPILSSFQNFLAQSNQIKSSFGVNESDINKVIRLAREVHGRAILEKSKYLDRIKGNPTSEDLVRLSAAASVIDTIGQNIRKLETRNPALNRFNTETDFYTQTVNTQAYNTQAYGNGAKNITAANSKAVIKNDPNDPNKALISIQNSDVQETIFGRTDTATDGYNPYDTKSLNEMTFTNINTTETAAQNTRSGLQKVGDTISDWINNLTTEGAKPFLTETASTTKSLQKKTQFGGCDPKMITPADVDMNVPYIFNYWGHKCGASMKFKPTWEKFIANVQKADPKVQIADIDVNESSENFKLAEKEIGTDKGIALPTVVVQYKGKKDRSVGDTSYDELIEWYNKFIKSNK